VEQRTKKRTLYLRWGGELKFEQMASIAHHKGDSGWSPRQLVSPPCSLRCIGYIDKSHGIRQDPRALCMYIDIDLGPK
jgi:hypothetical protein